MTNPAIELLKSVKAFADLPVEALDEIAAACVLREFEAEQTVVAHLEKTTAVFFLVSGTVRATLFTGQGREISYQDLGPGDMFGELAALDQQPRVTAVVTREASALLSMPGSEFIELMDRYPQIARATMLKLANMVRFLCDRVYNFGALDVSGRVRLELVRLAAELGVRNEARAVEIEIPQMPKHQDIASRLATHREAVSRELSSLEKRGLIRRGKGGLTILDIGELQASIGG